MFEDEGPVGAQKACCRTENGREAGGLHVGVRRIEEHEIERAFDLFERTLDTAADDGDSIFEIERARIVLDREDRVARLLDENGRCCTTRERLERERSGSRVEVEHRRLEVVTDEARRDEDRKERLPYSVRCGARGDAAWRAKRTRTMNAARDPHGPHLTTRSLTLCRPRLSRDTLLHMLRLALAIVMLALLVAVPRAARADVSSAHSVSVAVLAFESEDAEEQADALTGSLRSRIRASQGWSLVETSQSLGMLTAALRCSGKPLPSDCQQRIGEQIKSERYIYGYVTKGPVGQVTAEVHLYQKGKPDTLIKESYADNLKDQNDDTLRKVAQRILDRLGGTAVGTVVVRMGTENGEVIVDGDKHVPLSNGLARVELAPGGHSVEVQVAGGSQKRNVVVTAGKETVVEMSPGGSSGDPGRDDKPFPTRKILGGGLMVLGAIATTVGIVSIANWASVQDKDDEGSPYRQFQGEDACNAGSAGKELCDFHKDSERSSIIAWITTPTGLLMLGAGGYLFFVDGGSTEKTAKVKAPKPKTNVMPTLGGLVIRGTF